MNATLTAKTRRFARRGAARLLAFALLSVFFLAAAAPAAHAETIQFPIRVVTDAGNAVYDTVATFPQSGEGGAYFPTPGVLERTDRAGNLSWSAERGATVKLYVWRTGECVDELMPRSASPINYGPFTVTTNAQPGGAPVTITLPSWLPKPGEPALSDAEKHFVWRVNQLRAQLKFAPVEIDPRMNAAAAAHSAWQSARIVSRPGWLGHCGAENSEPDQRLFEAGFVGTISGIEEITSTHERMPSPDAIFDLYAGSAGHLGAILNPNSRFIGVGFSGRHTTAVFSRDCLELPCGGLGTGAQMPEAPSLSPPPPLALSGLQAQLQLVRCTTPGRHGCSDVRRAGHRGWKAIVVARGRVSGASTVLFARVTRGGYEIEVPGLARPGADGRFLFRRVVRITPGPGAIVKLRRAWHQLRISAYADNGEAARTVGFH